MATRSDSSPISDYLKEIKEFSLLTPDEERELGELIQAASQSESLLAVGEISPKEHERVQIRAAEARNRMIQANLRLVICVAKNFRNRGLPMEDLVNEGNVGLVNAVDRFDPTVGSRFSTYASYWIDQAIRRAVQNASQMIHIPSYLMEQIGQMRLALRSLEEHLGRQPTIHELAEHMEISPRKAKAVAQAIRACGCPTQAGSDEEGNPITDSLADERTPAPFEQIFSKSDNDFVTNLLSRITEREAVVLKLRYGLDGRKGKRMTLKEIGAAVGLTRERVRQIEKEAKQKLEEYVREYV